MENGTCLKNKNKNRRLNVKLVEENLSVVFVCLYCRKLAFFNSRNYFGECTFILVLPINLLNPVGWLVNWLAPGFGFGMAFRVLYDVTTQMQLHQGGFGCTAKLVQNQVLHKEWFNRILRPRGFRIMPFRTCLWPKEWFGYTEITFLFIFKNVKNHFCHIRCFSIRSHFGMLFFLCQQFRKRIETYWKPMPDWKLESWILICISWRSSSNVPNAHPLSKGKEVRSRTLKECTRLTNWSTHDLEVTTRPCWWFFNNRSSRTVKG